MVWGATKSLGKCITTRVLFVNIRSHLGEPCFPLTDTFMASTFTGSTLMVVVAGYAFGWSRRSDRYMCHRGFGLAFGCSDDEGYGCEVGGGGAV